MARGGQAGRARERQVAEKLRLQGWVVVKGTSFGTCDLVALRAKPSTFIDDRSCDAWLIEVKSTTYGPYDTFGPADRRELGAAAALAGAQAVLAWWPPRGKLQLIFEDEWPGTTDAP